MLNHQSVNLYLYTFSKLPPSVSAPKFTKTAAQGVKSAVLVVVEPLLSVLVANKNFANLLTKESLEIDKEDHFSHCCLLVLLLTILPKTAEDVFTYWVMPSNYPEEECRFSLVEAVFKSFKRCVLEICLPVFVDGVMCNGQPARAVTFYEHVCTRMCVLVAATPVTCFPVVERCLLEKVLEDDLLCALLASDVWCFMARWGSAKLCAGHVTVLTQLLLKLPTAEAAYSHLSLLIQRLVRLMAVEHQENLLRFFPPYKEENVAAWCVFPLQDMPEVVKKKACHSLVPLCIKTCHSVTATKQPVKNDDILCHCLYCLRVICNLTQVEEYVPPVQRSAVVGLVNNLWSVSSQGIENELLFDPNVWCELLDLSSTLLHLIQPEDYAKIVCALKTLLGKCSGVELREAASQFLGKCGSKEIPGHLESAVLGDITALFSTLVSDKHWLVHQRAFQSVKSFAEVTRYTHVMGDCVPENLLPTLSDFLNELPYRHSEFSRNTEFVKEFIQRHLKEEEARQTRCSDPDRALDEEEIPLMDSGSRSRGGTRTGQSDEPEAKRLKLNQDSSRESQGEELYEEAVKKMQIPLSTILDLRNRFVPTPKIVQQMKEMQRILQDFLSKSPD